MNTTATYRCEGCGKKIRAPEGLCAKCFRELKDLMAQEKQSRKLKKKKKK